MEQEQAAYEHIMREELLATQEGQYVTIHGGELVDADADQMALARRINADYPDRVVHIRFVRRGPNPVLHFRSPRFINRVE